MFSALEAIKKLEVVKRSTLKTLDLIPQVDAILKIFDGRVFNKRLQAALQGADPSIIVRRPYATNGLLISVAGQRFNNVILSSKCLITGNGKTYRISYDLAHKDLLDEIIFLTRELDRIAFSIANYENVVKEIGEHKDRIRELNKSLHWTVQL